MTTRTIVAEELEYGDVFIHCGRTYTWDGDAYDEDTLWITEQGTMVPFALDVHEEVELCT